MAREDCLLGATHLVALEAFKGRTKLIEPGESFSVEYPDVKSFLLDGRAELARLQDHPPTETLNDLTADLLDCSRLGPICLAVKAIQNVEEQILPSGLPRNAVAGSVLHWKAGTKELESAVLSNLTVSRELYLSLIHQFTSCMEAKLKSSATVHFTTGRLSDAEAIEKGLAVYKVPSRAVRSLQRESGSTPRQWEYAATGRDWAEFKIAVDRFQGLLNKLTLTALQDGRILAAKRVGELYRLIAPWVWNESAEKPRLGKDWNYLFSRDLPSEWFPKAKQLRGPERERMISRIVADLHSRYIAAAPNHSAYKKEPIIAELASQHGVGKTLVREAWSKADLPNWSVPGVRKSR